MFGQLNWTNLEIDRKALSTQFFFSEYPNSPTVFEQDLTVE